MPLSEKLKVLHLCRGSLATSSRVQSQIAIDGGICYDKLPLLSFQYLNKIRQHVVETNKNIVVLHQQQMLVFAIALIVTLPRRRHRQLLIDLHDKTTSPWKSNSLKSFILLSLQNFIFLTLRFFDVNFMTVSSWHAAYFGKYINKHVSVVFSMPKPIELIKAKPLIRNASPRLVYFGILTPSRLSLKLLDKISNLRNVNLAIYGQFGKDQVYNEKLNLMLSKCDNIQFVGSYTGNSIVQSIANANALLIYFECMSDLNLIHCLPNKLFQSLSIGLPVIINPDMIECASILDELSAFIPISECANNSQYPSSSKITEGYRALYLKNVINYEFALSSR